MPWLVVSFAGILGIVFLVFQIRTEPPKEKELIEGFNRHRPAYEQLRAMLLSDNHLLRVAEWGIETTSAAGIQHPPEGGLSLARYHEYLSLVKDAGAMSASRSSQEPPDICILVWASGWAADTRHVETCWLEHEPENQVSSLDSFYHSPKPRHPVFKHIDTKWYLWADW